ncbi:Hypothetical predicted protein [Paramuricea clavata]|uniref:Uncharacterized protein n=1 Tax=Paramuricea clavata TaxID=317549 RepID=A0A6S7J9B8_PARCT|nr:Hypothetical predicted protein [Paramuricea clavata]
METLKTAFILSALLVCYSDARRSKAVYKINIDEKGTGFNETVEINDKEKNVVYTVPEHNGLVGSEILFDYKTGFFATRIPKLKECYIQRIPKRYFSPGLVRKNLERYQVFKESKSIVPVETIKEAVMKGRRINPRELSSSLSAFCGDFVAYEAIQIDHQQRFPIKRNETNGNVRRKRVTVYDVTPIALKVDIDVDKNGKWVTITLDTCKRWPEYLPELEKGGCAGKPDTYEYHCGAKAETCMYSVKCKFDRNVHKYRCKETHFFTGWTCCNVSCA